MFRPMASDVSSLSGLVANGHQVLHSVSSSLSKIPYGGFSPVRLQIGIGLRPSPGTHTRPGLIRSHQSAHPSPTSIPFRGNRRTRAALEERSDGRFRSRGPWLTSGLSSPAGSMLTMASSASLSSVRRLMVLRPVNPADNRESQLLSACPFFRAIGPTPADRVACGGSIAHPCCLRRSWKVSASAWSDSSVHVGGVTRLHRSLYATARRIAHPTPKRAFTFELSSHESPHWNVEHDYAGNAPFPAVGLSPTGQAALLAAPKVAKKR